MRSLWYGIRQRLCRWCDGCWYIVAILLLFNQHFFDSRVVLKTFLWGIMVAATVDMVASAHVIREQDLCLLVNISGKTGFHAAFWASDLVTCLVSLKMESVFTHISVCIVTANRSTICSLQSLQFCKKTSFSESQDCKTEETASCNARSFIVVLG